MRKSMLCLAVAMPLASAAPLAAETGASVDGSVDELFDPAAIARSICTGGGGALRQPYQPAARYAMSRVAFWRKADDAVLMDNLGSHSYTVTTTVQVAQQFFDQGLRLAYGFNHWESARAFRKAQKLDPNCAMCYWGEALVLGPNINAAMVPGDNEMALAALAKAQAAASSASPSEQALIGALAKRYSADASADHGALDQAYAKAMGAVSRLYPDDLDIAVLYAEAVMDVQPWDYWLPGGKKTKGTSGEALAALERVLAKNPEHPGAIHYYIHMVEASANPERAAPYAERLAALMPGAGHIVHMPGHIWYVMGRYRDALLSSEAAARADEAYFKLTEPGVLYRESYYTHNLHFVVVSAHMQGDAKAALEFSDKLLTLFKKMKFADDMLDASPWIHQILAAPYFAMADMATSERTLSEAEPEARLPFEKAMWHFARGNAFTRLTRFDEARAEVQAIEQIGESADFSSHVAGGMPSPEILAVAAAVLNARIARAAGDIKSAIALFTSASEAQEALPYTEPPFWYYPVRRSLGAALLAAGRTDEAIQAFRQVLIEAPNDAYALYGLARAYEHEDNAAAAEKTDRLFAKAWAGGDVTPELAAY
jgi:tetratricopeptide (TPR) repeat protein